MLASAHMESTRSAAAKILVVDDDRDICEVVANILSTTGAQIHLAVDGTEALAVLSKSAIDLAIIDLLFGGPISSDMVVQHAAIRGCQVITMSGTLASDPRGRELTHPHIFKPFGTDQLIELVMTTLARKGRPSAIL
jgi:two-component system OmpR family response regulator